MRIWFDKIRIPPDGYRWLYGDYKKEEEYLFYSRLGNKMNERGVNSCFKYIAFSFAIAERTGFSSPLYSSTFKLFAKIGKK